MRPSPRSKSEFFETLPPPWPDSLADAISRQLSERKHCLVVLDDDPTGSQSVHGVTILTRCTHEEICQELARSSTCYLLTNSRSMDEPSAVALMREVGQALKNAALAASRSITVAIRAGADLRGHFPHDVEALGTSLGTGFAGTILCPAAPEHGYYTIDDVQWLEQGDVLVPISQTDEASDPDCGFSQSHLPSWVEEKSGGAIRADQVISIGLDILRSGGPGAVASLLRELQRGPHSTIVVNAADDRDLEVFAAGLLTVEAEGIRFIYRTAAPFIRVRAGIGKRLMCDAHDVSQETGSGGLVVVGSHHSRTNEQLERALSMPGVVGIELPVPEVIDRDARPETMARLSRSLTDSLSRGEDVVLFTTRETAQGRDAEHTAEISEAISVSLCELLGELPRAPRYLIAKGCNTASDLTTRGLAARRATALGQLLPGVPVWRLDKESRHPGLGIVIFPGRVGRPESLAVAMAILRKNQDS